MVSTPPVVAFRSPLAITGAVWRALFLREAISRISSGRAAWAWLLLEPIAHAAFIMVLYRLVRVRSIPGADAAVWLLVGYVAYFTARNVFSRGMEAISANQALFVYRQVLPVDAVLVRGALEVFLGLLVAAGVLAGLALLGRAVLPHDTLQVLLAFQGMCLCGLGIGLILSVGNELVPEVGRVAGMLFTPLYLLSGVMFPLALVPVQYREWVFYNPFAHGLELIRMGFFPYYHGAPESSLAYVYQFALVVVFLGLALHVRFTDRLRSQ